MTDGVQIVRDISKRDNGMGSWGGLLTPSQGSASMLEIQVRNRNRTWASVQQLRRDSDCNRRPRKRLPRCPAHAPNNVASCSESIAAELTQN